VVFRLFTADFWAKAKATSSGQGGHAAAKATASAQLPEFASDIFSLSQRKTHINPPFVVSMGNMFFFGCALQIQGYFRKVVLDIVDEVLLESMVWLV